MNGINFREEEVNELKTLYSDFHENMTSNFKEMIEELNTISSQTEYIQIMNYVNKLIAYYNEEFHENLESDFEKWRESSSSFSKFVLKLENSEQPNDSEAFNVAQKIEEDLKESIQQTSSLEDLNHPVGSINLSDNHFDEFKEVVQLYLSEDGKLLNQCQEIKQNLNQRNEDNMIFGMILPLITSFEKRLQHSLENYVKQVDVQKEEFMSSKSALSDATESVTKEIERNSADFTDYFSKFKAKF